MAGSHAPFSFRGAALGLLSLGGALSGMAMTAVPAAAASVFPADSTVRSILKARVDSGQVAGIVVGLLENGQTRVIAYGRADSAGTRPLDGRTVFEIGSATKVFTSTLLADMVRRGEVRLDQPVADLLPRGTKVPERDGRKITLLDLATHRSSLPRIPTNLAQTDSTNPYAGYTAERLYAFLADYSLPRPIGASYEYSNLGAGLLGHALALRAGRSYEAVLIERVLTPLGMNDTRMTLNDDLRSRLAVGHDQAGKPVRNWDLGVLAGAGGLRSTADDMLRFLAANLDSNSKAILTDLRMARRPRAHAGSEDVEIGLAWHIIHHPTGDIVMHNGATGGYHSVLAFEPERRHGVVVLANTSTDIDDIARHLLDASEPVKNFTRHDEVAIDPRLLGDYVGRYALNPSFVIEVTREGNQLFVQATGQQRLPVYAESESRFFLRVVEAQVSFDRDSAGKVTQLVLHQNGSHQPGKRLP
jgi:CubicO group peptidase (beta-lactamase class C family)